jgi:hypothetical protein
MRRLAPEPPILSARLHIVALVATFAVMLAACTSGPFATTGGGAAEAVLDHHLCYFFDETHFNPPNGVTVKDQFLDNPTSVTFTERDFLCNPVEKSSWRHDSPIRHQEAHLFCYRFDARKPLDGVVKVHNQFDPWFFGAQTLHIEETWGLCLPAGKKPITSGPPPIPTDIDHFMCYRVTPEDDVNRNVALKDQFLAGNSTIKRAFLLCNPTEKWFGKRHEVPEHREAHLVCYTVDTPTFTPRQVRVGNQFEANFLVTPRVHPPYLCVPSSKVVISRPKVPPPNTPQG